jgi:DNA-directed RNA polymerase subunit alpha
MLATKNFGKKSLGEIRDILRGMELDFGMQFDEQGNPIPGTGESESLSDLDVENEAEGGDEEEFGAAVQ